MIDNHMFVLNAIGEERSQQVLFPLIKEAIENGESFFATNSNGKLIDYLTPDLKKNNYRVFYLDFSDANSDWQWNPLQHPYQLFKRGDIDASIEQVSLLASAIMEKDSHFNKQDPFWSNAAAGLFEALALSLFKNADSHEVNLLSILDMALEGNSRFAASTYLREYFMLEQCKDFYKNAATYLNAPTDTRGSISTVFIQGLSNVLGNKLFSRHLLTDTINLQRIPQYKTAIIVNITESALNTTLIGMLITQIYHVLLKDRKSNQHNYKPFTFYLDRFLSIGRIPRIERILPYSLYSDIHFVLLVDNIAMLESVYDADIGRVIREYCARWIIYPTRNLKFLEELNGVLDIYVGSNKELLLNELRSNIPILFDEEQGIAPYMSSGEGVFSFQPSRRRQGNFLPLEPDVFSIKDYTEEEKRKDLFVELENRDQISEAAKDGLQLGSEGRVSASEGTSKKVSLDIDDLVRRIDQKIQELEEEEAKQSGKNSN